MDVDSALSTIPPVSETDSQHPTRPKWPLMAGAAGGGLALMIYAYAAFRWGPIDDVSILALGFGLLLVAYAVLAVFGVRAGVIAPFVVAALLLPWACGAGAMAGVGQRVDSAIGSFSEDLSVDDDATVAPDEAAEELSAPSDEDLSAASDEEAFPSPPADAPAAAALGVPVAFEQELGGGEVAKWSVKVTDVECGVASLPKAEYNDDGSMGTATPRSGNEFCLVETDWTNAGKAEAGGATILGNLMVGGTAVERLDKDAYRGLAVMQQRNLDGMTTIKPGKTVTQLDVFEVPDGTVPDAVWLTRDQPKVLAALN